jgi:hypothetical protein
VTLGCRKVDLDLQGGLGHLGFHPGRENARNGGQRPADVISRVSQRCEVLPVDANHQLVPDLVPGSGDAILGVRPNAGVQTRVSRRDVAYTVKGCLVIGIWRHG